MAFTRRAASSWPAAGASRASSLRLRPRPRERRRLLRRRRPAAASPRARRGPRWRSGPTSRRSSARSPSSSPLWQRRSRKSQPARKRGCSSRRYGRWPERCSKRGCSDQISLIVASNRRGIAICFAWRSSTVSIASNSAGIGALAARLARRSTSRAPRARAASRTGSRRHAAVLAHALVGVGERELDEALAERLLEDHVEQRQQPVRQAVRAQALQRLDARGPDSSSFCISSNSRAGGHVLDQRRELRDRRRGLRLDRDAELGREAHRAQHPHRVLAVAGHRRRRSASAGARGCRRRRRRSPRSSSVVGSK